MVRIRNISILLACAAGALAQTAQITGRITDASAAIIPGASLTVRNVATGLERKISSNNEGYYTAPLLPPGEYSISVEHQGFRPVVRSGVVLEVDQRAEINFVLEVGQVAERIEVRATALQLNTQEASQGQVIENQRIVDLPLNGRNYDELTLLSAGTVQPLGGSRFEGFSSGGMRNTQNNFILDGVDNNPAELAGAQRRSEMVQPSIDGIQEFKVQTNAYAAEYGRAMGSVVNVTTKSGTNDLHGTAFEFLRNEKLDAKNFFDPADKPKPPFKRNQYGFSVGGPVYIPKILNGRNRLFFFGDFEGTRIRVSNTTTSTIPTARMKSGDFGELLTLRRPPVTLTDPDNNSLPFPGNTIPAARFDPVAKTLIDLYPAPQTADLAANYVYQSPAPTNWRKFDVRTDVNLGAKDNFFWRLSKQNQTVPAALNLPPPAYGGGSLDQSTEGINTGATWNHIWKPDLIMSIRGAWNYGFFTRDNPAQTKGELLNRKYGIKGGNDTVPGGFSQMNITGYRALGIGANNPVARDSQNRQLAGDLIWIRGAHTLKAGANFLRPQNNIFNIRNEVIGPIQFNGRYTKDGMADFLLGRASQVTWSTRLQVNLRMWNDAAFIQDDWKVTPNLTVNLGLRYEVVLPFLDKRDRMGVFDIWTNPASPRLIKAGQDGSDRYNRAMIATDKNNFMPRIGFAYKLGTKTVVRSGYGIFYALMEPYGDAEWLIGNPPDAFGVVMTSSLTVPAMTLAAGPPPGAFTLARATGVTLSSIDRGAITPYAQQWNFNIQRELGADWMAEIGYAGSKGTHVERRYDANYAPPGEGNPDLRRPFRSAVIPGTDQRIAVGATYGYRFNGNSIYHALITRVEKRFSQGFTLLTSYTWSKAIGDVCGNAASGNTTDCGFQDARNMRAERSVDNIHIPHRFVLSSVYELPVGKGRHFGARMPRVWDALFGGWSIGSIVVTASGQPYNVVNSGNPANSGTFDIVSRPNVTGNPYAATRTLDQDFNTSVFVATPPYQFGNAGRNILRQRSFFNWDFSTNKTFRLVESVKLQFRFEAFHFTNTPRFGQAGGVLGTATFGKITGAGTPRNLQFGLKLVW
ncbi:MAG: TonB-dependent receptor domain-containing protein [Bryobacteraceae bacterium]